jgi:flagellar biosynthesis protein FlhF
VFSSSEKERRSSSLIQRRLPVAVSLRKAYFARTLEAALAAARRELGPDALLIEAGPAAPGEGSGAYRVVCEAPQANSGDAPAPVARSEPQVGPPLDGLPQRLAKLERTLQLVAGAVAGLDPEPASSAVRADLAAQDFPPEWAAMLLQAARARLRQGPVHSADADEAALRAAVAEEVISRIDFRPVLGPGSPAVVVLAGPPGAGKTSLLVKLAMREALGRRRSAAIVTTDGHRVAAAEQLRTYAAILGLPFCQAETEAALRQAVAEQAARDLIFVDTPGFGRNEPEWAAEWAGLLGSVPGCQTLLVLPASWRTRDLLAALSWWALFKPSALAFTRLDETDSVGGWAVAALESGLPVAYFSTGQGIPEDLEPASGERLRAALGAQQERQAAAGRAAGGA